MNTKSFLTRKIFLISLFAFISLFSLGAKSEEGTLVKAGQYWNVYKTNSGVVYMASKPIKKEGTYSKRDQPYLLISNFNNEIEVSVYTGYTHKADSLVKMVVNMSYKDASQLESFLMRSSGERAWFVGNDKEVISKLRLGASVTLKAVSYKGTTSEDTYSLNGFSSAYSIVTASKNK